MSERWREYIGRGIESAGGPIPFALTQWMFLFPVFLAIRRALPGGGRLLDVGCGAGVFTALLAHHGYTVTGIDDDDVIVTEAREMVRYFRSAASIERASAFDLQPFHGRFDLAFSLGVVEHFDADVTVALLGEQLRCAPVVLTVVPTRHTAASGKVTDERLYNRRQVEGLVRRAGCSVNESFVFGEVPSAVRRNAERLLPGAVERRLQHYLTWGMGICVVGKRA
jgi:SAM-dependent methyltransferase